MSSLPRLHHHDIMTIVGLFTHCRYVIYIYIRNVRTSRNVGDSVHYIMANIYQTLLLINPLHTSSGHHFSGQPRPISTAP